MYQFTSHSIRAKKISQALYEYIVSHTSNLAKMKAISNPDRFSGVPLLGLEVTLIGCDIPASWPLKKVAGLRYVLHNGDGGISSGEIPFHLAPWNYSSAVKASGQILDLTAKNLVLQVSGESNSERIEIHATQRGRKYYRTQIVPLPPPIVVSVEFREYLNTRPIQ